MPHAQNRRRANRKLKSIPCQLIRHSDRQVFPEQTTDLSEAGMFIESDAGLVVGDTLTVSFQTGDLGLWVDAQATIVRLVRGRRREDRGGVGFGLRFDGLEAVKRLVVRGALRRARPPLPRRKRDACPPAPAPPAR
ncbi:MAG: PilZ domain-containing protein [Myxococcales bacterium]|jgi:hypothetical protein|nr:PilZ domain-containing protein [Myxococcales bacterium]MBL0193851.1 PilZ domain-containing protein [Myxococcales bacterium]HQY63417.1 PilZ domain-containing protein [Polyangiaceae bacterium]